MRCSTELSPKAKKLYDVAKHLRKSVKRLFVNKVDYKERLKKAEQFASSPEHLQLRLNAVSFKFVMSQIKLQNMPKKLRRFTFDDKLLALALMKQCPRGYSFLSRIFALPSKRTLRKILAGVPLNTGINKAIMNCLGASVKRMDILDTYCVILFDEIALEASVLYNRNSDIIDGFQDNGFDNRYHTLADKAMVFMARGIHKKWKQPLAYYFNSGGMKSEMIAKCLKDVVREARLIGLNVVGTICDQAFANTKAIRILYEETKREYALRGLENKFYGFLIDDIEIVPLYDPPHLLKGIRNNLFENDCRFKWRNEKVETASWNDIRNLYGLEETEDEFKMCNKLTDIHVNNTKKMKVSIAAQVLSQRVASLMRGLARLGKKY